MTKYLASIFLCLVLCSCGTQVQIAKQKEAKYLTLINWNNSWDEKIFDQAKESNKPIILSLEARWCHWCHVMTEETYTNPEISKLLNENFIPVRIDQDSNSYLSNRYKDYGWPATIIFNSKGEELLKKAGYIEANELKEILDDVLKNPNKKINPAKTFQYASSSSLDAITKSTLIKRYKSSLDLRNGGLKTRQKYIDRDTMEYALGAGLKGDSTSKNFSILTLNQGLYLLDKEFGGFYQYSTAGRWDKAHYEKLTEIQAEYIRIYSLAYLFTQDPNYKKAVQQTFDYMNQFMSNKEGAFYASQDADLIRGEKATNYFKLSKSSRLKLGVPPIDTNIFANKNGLMIEALINAYRMNSDEKFLRRAIKAYNAIKKSNYRDGYYIHSSQDPQPYLADNLYMGRAELALYLSTAERHWLKKAIKTAAYITKNFKAKEPGYLSLSQEAINSSKVNSILKPEPILSENLKLLRFLNLLAKYSGNEHFMQEAKNIMRYTGSSDLIQNISTEPGILIADEEINEAPIHFTILGSKKDPKASSLFKHSLKYPSSYIRVEWFDPQEGRLMNHDVEYPPLKQAAAFKCENKTCSLPIYNPKELFN